MLTKGVKPEDILEDADMIDLIASLKYIRVNYVHFDSPEKCMYEALSLAPSNPSVLSEIQVQTLVLRWGLANRTAEKQRPGPLELTLLFKALYLSLLFRCHSSHSWWKEHWLSFLVKRIVILSLTQLFPPGDSTLQAPVSKENCHPRLAVQCHSWLQ